jgi:hypothetical protein
MATKSKQWFEVDKDGLQQLIERRGKAFVVTELIQNAWDEDVTAVDVGIRYDARTRRAFLDIQDDSPDGFSDLRDAFTLFKASKKKADAEKRGRFNLGEKLVLALASRATIRTTKGTVSFDKDGRTTDTAKRRQRGTVFTAEFPTFSAQDVVDTIALAFRLIPPGNVTTHINGNALKQREPLVRFEATLPTEISGPEGGLRRSNRKAWVEVYEPWDGNEPGIYELGIPVVDTEDRFVVNVCQKVPLNIERDNVTPAYLRQLRTLVANNTVDLLTGEDATSTWVNEALTSPDIAPAAVQKIVTERFGDRAVLYDPNDREANERATAAGYSVIGARTLPKEAWTNIRRVEDLLPVAGAVTPGSNTILARQLEGEGEGRKPLPFDKWTAAHKAFADYAQRFALYTINQPVSVEFFHDTIDVSAAAWYARGSRKLTINIARLGKAWLKSDTPTVDELLIHEFAHDRVSDHLSDRFHDECCRIGSLAKLRATEIGEYKS